MSFGFAAVIAGGAEPQPVHHAGAEVLDEHIRAPATSFKARSLVAGLLQVEHDAALAAVPGGVRGRYQTLGPPGGSMRTTSAPWSASSIAAIGPETHCAEIDYPDPVERSHGRLRVPNWRAGSVVRRRDRLSNG